MNILAKLFQKAGEKEKAMTATAVQTETLFRNFVGELKDASNRLHQAEVRLRALNSEIAATEAEVEKTEKRLRESQGFGVEPLLDRRTKLGWKLRELGEKLPDVERERRYAEGERDDIRNAINTHPLRVAVLDEQRKIVLEAAEIGAYSWNLPLSEIPAAIKRFDAIADREYKYVVEQNGAMTRLGLPEIQPRLYNRRIVMPIDVLKIPPSRRDDAARAMAELLAF